MIVSSVTTERVFEGVGESSVQSRGVGVVDGGLEAGVVAEAGYAGIDRGGG